MKKGYVVGHVWATKRLKELPAGALLAIDLEDPSGSPERVIAFDPLGCGEGEHVLVVQGSVAKGWFDAEANAVIDALVIGSLDEPSPSVGESKIRRRRS